MKEAGPWCWRRYSNIKRSARVMILPPKLGQTKGLGADSLRLQKLNLASSADPK